MRIRDGRWHPMGTETVYSRPEEGALVAFERSAWRVTHIRVDTPTEDEAKQLLGYRPEYRDKHMPYKISLRRVHGAKHPRENSAQDIALRGAGASYASVRWETYEDDMVPLCSCCGHPWPCLMLEAKQISEQDAAIFAGRLAKAYPGICYGCGEVITTRQGSVSYPEENVDIPGYPPPRFHTRLRCREWQLGYEHRRAVMYPDKPAVIEDPWSRVGSVLWNDEGDTTA